RLGVVLALMTSWPAFQTLEYRTMIDGPGEIAAIILPASGLPADGLDGRVQQAYDTIRLGVMDVQAVPTQQGAAQSAQPAPGSQLHFQSPLPNTASLLVISTSGLAGILKLVVGILL